MSNLHGEVTLTSGPEHGFDQLILAEGNADDGKPNHDSEVERMGHTLEDTIVAVSRIENGGYEPRRPQKQKVFDERRQCCDLSNRVHRCEDVQVGNEPKIVKQLCKLLTRHVMPSCFGLTSAMDTVSLFETNSD